MGAGPDAPAITRGGAPPASPARAACCPGRGARTSAPAIRRSSWPGLRTGRPPRPAGPRPSAGGATVSPAGPRPPPVARPAPAGVVDVRRPQLCAAGTPGPAQGPRGGQRGERRTSEDGPEGAGARTRCGTASPEGRQAGKACGAPWTGEGPGAGDAVNRAGHRRERALARPARRALPLEETPLAGGPGGRGDEEGGRRSAREQEAAGRPSRRDRRGAVRHAMRSWRVEEPGEAEAVHADGTAVVEQDVTEGQVTVDDAPGVDHFEGARDLERDRQRLRLRREPAPGQGPGQSLPGISSVATYGALRSGSPKARAGPRFHLDARVNSGAIPKSRMATALGWSRPPPSRSAEAGQRGSIQFVRRGHDLQEDLRPGGGRRHGR